MTNKIPRRKNRIEKGVRAFDRGSNPHSKGDNFSRFFLGGFLKRGGRKRSASGIIIINKGVRMEDII